MDIATLTFVGGLCLLAAYVTVTVRRELLARERRGRQDGRAPRRPRRKP